MQQARMLEDTFRIWPVFCQLWLRTSFMRHCNEVFHGYQEWRITWNKKMAFEVGAGDVHGAYREYPPGFKVWGLHARNTEPEVLGGPTGTAS